MLLDTDLLPFILTHQNPEIREYAAYVLLIECLPQPNNEFFSVAMMRHRMIAIYIDMMVCQLLNGDNVAYLSLYRLLPSFALTSYPLFMDALMVKMGDKLFVPYEMYAFLINRMHDSNCLSSSVAQSCLDLFVDLELPKDPDFQYANLKNACMICLNALPASLYNSRMRTIIACVNESRVSLFQLLEMVCLLEKSEFLQSQFDFNPIFDHLLEMLLSELQKKHYAKCSGLLVVCTFFVSYNFTLNSDIFAELWDVLWNHSDQRFILNHLKEIQELLMIAPPSMYDTIMVGMLKDNRLETVNPKCWMLIFRIWKAVNDVYHFFELGNAIESVQGYVETWNRVNDRNSERSFCILSFSSSL